MTYQFKGPLRSEEADKLCQVCTMVLKNHYLDITRYRNESLGIIQSHSTKYFMATKIYSH